MKPATEPTVGQLFAWLIATTRPVLTPLALSTICRILNQILGIVIYVVPAYALIAHTLSIKTVISTMIIAALAKAFLRYLEHYLGHLVAFKALELIRITVFRAMYPQAPAIVSCTGVHAVGSGDMLTRLTRDISQIEVFFAHTTAPVISAVVVPTAVVIGIALVSPWQGLIATGILLLVALISIDTSAYRFATGITTARGSIAQHITDSVGGVAEITGYGAEERRNRELADREAPLARSFIRRSILVGSRTGFVAAARMSVVLMLLPGTDNLAFSVAAMFTVLRCWDMISEVTDLGNHLAQALAATRRVWGLAHAGLELPAGPTLIDAHGPGLSVEWRDVSFSYDNTPTPVVCNVSVRVAPGSWTTVVGTTGSGKSTIAKLLLRYWDVDSGVILLDGRDIRDYDVAALRAAVVVVTQDIRPINATVAENLCLAQPDATDAELNAALHIACLDDEVQLTDAVGEGGAALSGGQRQRLSLAQAVLRGGRVLVVDEFTAHLNPALVAQVRSRLQAAFPTMTVIEIAHDLDNIDAADWVAVMDQGAIIEQGEPAALRAQRGVLHHLLHRDQAS
ncbi:MAG: ATP-binding cassette domain-containing protein [Corynebacterium sp.]|nr:ATP-binding cassette domain-containing protein [Corynebacterium sp.]